VPPHPTKTTTIIKKKVIKKGRTAPTQSFSAKQSKKEGMPGSLEEGQTTSIRFEQEKQRPKESCRHHCWVGTKPRVSSRGEKDNFTF
jgi:hypothetical protein